MMHSTTEAAPHRDVINVRLRSELVSQLDAEARRRVVSRTFLIEAAITAFLQDGEQ